MSSPKTLWFGGLENLPIWGSIFPGKQPTANGSTAPSVGETATPVARNARLASCSSIPSTASCSTSIRLKMAKLFGGLWGVVYVYKAVFIGGLPKTPILLLVGPNLGKFEIDWNCWTVHWMAFFWRWNPEKPSPKFEWFQCVAAKGRR